MPNPFHCRAHIERHTRLADPASPEVPGVKRVTTVSVETMKIVDGLPPLREAR